MLRARDSCRMQPVQACQCSAVDSRRRSPRAARQPCAPALHVGAPRAGSLRRQTPPLATPWPLQTPAARPPAAGPAGLHSAAAIKIRPHRAPAVLPRCRQRDQAASAHPAPACRTAQPGRTRAPGRAGQAVEQARTLVVVALAVQLAHQQVVELERHRVQLGRHERRLQLGLRLGVPAERAAFGRGPAALDQWPPGGGGLSWLV